MCSCLYLLLVEIMCKGRSVQQDSIPQRPACSTSGRKKHLLNTTQAPGSYLSHSAAHSGKSVVVWWWGRKLVSQTLIQRVDATLQAVVSFNSAKSWMEWHVQTGKSFSLAVLHLLFYTLGSVLNGILLNLHDIKLIWKIKREMDSHIWLWLMRYF